MRTSDYCDLVTVPTGLVEEVARRFALLSDPTRLRILDALLERGDITVTELAGVVGEAAPNVSQHLSRLLAADIVGRRRDGRTVRYAGSAGCCRRPPATGSAGAALRRRFLGGVAADLAGERHGRGAVHQVGELRE